MKHLMSYSNIFAPFLPHINHVMYINNHELIQNSKMTSQKVNFAKNKQQRGLYYKLSTIFTSTIFHSEVCSRTTKAIWGTVSVL